MNQPKTRIALAAGALLASGAMWIPLSGMADTQSGDMTKAMASTKVPDDELEFFTKAAQSGKTEVAAAKIATERSSDANIKRFAEKMITDHGKANDELMALAKKKGITLPTTIDDDHQEMLDDLRKSKDFDDEYSDAMHNAHDDAVDLFRETSKNAKDPDVKAFAARTLPTLESHQAMAKQLDAKR